MSRVTCTLVLLLWLILIQSYDIQRVQENVFIRWQGILLHLLAFANHSKEIVVAVKVKSKVMSNVVSCHPERD